MKVEVSRRLSLHTLIELAERHARERHGGHLTVMRFGSGWKAVYGTPNMAMSDDYGRGEYKHVFGLSPQPTVELALLDLLTRDDGEVDYEALGRQYLEDVERTAFERDRDLARSMGMDLVRSGPGHRELVSAAGPGAESAPSEPESPVYGVTACEFELHCPSCGSPNMHLCEPVGDPLHHSSNAVKQAAVWCELCEGVYDIEIIEHKGTVAIQYPAHDGPWGGTAHFEASRS